MAVLLRSQIISIFDISRAKIYNFFYHFTFDITVSQIQTKPTLKRTRFFIFFLLIYFCFWIRCLQNFCLTNLKAHTYKDFLLFDISWKYGSDIKLTLTCLKTTFFVHVYIYKISVTWYVRYLCYIKGRCITHILIANRRHFYHLMFRIAKSFCKTLFYIIFIYLFHKWTFPNEDMFRKHKIFG